jgi:hypothetical protein
VTPNPVSELARVQVALPASSSATLEVYSLSGSTIATLFDGEIGAGHHEIEANVSALNSGVYMLVFTAGDTKVSRTMTIVR